MDISKELELFEEFGVGEKQNAPNSTPYFFYNKALEKVKRGSDDMAIILLKKAIASDEFIPPAYILLSLCLYKNDEKKEARQVLKVVLDKDPENSLAKKYNEKLFNQSGNKTSWENSIKKKFFINKQTREKNETEEKKETEENRSQRKKKKKRKTGKTIKSLMPAIIVGLVLLFVGGTVGYITGYSNGNGNKKEFNAKLSDYKTQVLDFKDNESDLEQTIDRLESDIEKLSNENEDLEKEIENKDKEIKYQKGRFELLNIQTLIQNEDYKNAVDKLENTTSDNYTDEDKELYEKLYKEAYTKVSTDLYNQGMVLYEDNEHEKAYAFFLKAINYNINFDLMKNIYYRAARCQYELKNYQKAIEYFNIVTERYPDYKYMDFTMYYQGRAYQILGKYENAKECFEYARDNYPNSTLKNSIYARIKEVNNSLER